MIYLLTEMKYEHWVVSLREDCEHAGKYKIYPFLRNPEQFSYIKSMIKGWYSIQQAKLFLFSLVTFNTSQ